MTTAAVAFSHFGIHVTDLARMEDFYTRVVGLLVTDRGEGNRVELFVDTPWHTPQPFAEPFDIEAPVDAIVTLTERLCRSRPGFAMRAEWRAAQAARMATAG